MLTLPELPSANDDPRWRIDASCSGVDPDLFFPERGGSTKEAKEVCMACPVRKACLSFAIEYSEKQGVWGGMSERERRRLRLQKRAAGSAHR